MKLIHTDKTERTGGQTAVSSFVLGRTIFATLLLWDFGCGGSGGGRCDGLRRVYDYGNNHWYKKPGNPGVKVRVTKHGMDQFKDLVAETLATEFPKSSISNYNVNAHPFRVLFSNLGVRSFRPPQNHTLRFVPADNEIVIQFNNFDVELAGSFTGWYGSISSKGSLDGKITDLNLRSHVKVDRDENGTLVAKQDSCHTKIGAVNFNIHLPGIFGGIVAGRKGDIENLFRGRMPTILCGFTNSMIKDGLGELVRDVGGIIPIRLMNEESFRNNNPHLVESLNLTTNTTHPTPDRQFVANLQRDLILDNTLMGPGQVTENYIETNHVGEVRYSSLPRASTLFFPRRMRDEPFVDDYSKMIYLSASDYLLSSMLFHAYRMGRLDINIDSGDLGNGYEGFLQSSCGGRKRSSKRADLRFLKRNKKGELLQKFKRTCIGAIVPQLRQRYPNKQTILHISPNGIPNFRIVRGKPEMSGNARIMLQVDQGHRNLTVLTAETRAAADVPIALISDTNRFAGSANLKQMTLKLHRTSLPRMTANALNQLLPITRQLLQDQLEAALREGVSLPDFRYFRLVNPTLRLGDGYGQVGADFELKGPEIRAKLAEILASSLNLGA